MSTHLSSACLVIASKECFPVPEAGVFSVSVYEVLQDGSVGQKVWRLPDVTISAENTSLSVKEGKALTKL